MAHRQQVITWHGDAEIARPRHNRRIAPPHQQRHHGTDGPGDAHRIVQQIIQRLIAAAFGVPGQSFEQRLGQLPWNVKLRDDGSEGENVRVEAEAVETDGFEAGTFEADARAWRPD